MFLQVSWQQTAGAEMKPLTIVQLVDRIHTIQPDYKQKKATKLQILEKAVLLGLLKKEEIAVTTPRHFRVVKSYLHTVITDRRIRRRIDSYVKCLSTLWSRSLALLNLTTHRIAGIPFQRPKDAANTIHWWKQPASGEYSPGKEFFKLVFAGAPNACPEFL